MQKEEDKKNDHDNVSVPSRQRGRKKEKKQIHGRKYDKAKIMKEHEGIIQ
jgi:hypothetical protein